MSIAVSDASDMVPHGPLASASVSVSASVSESESESEAHMVMMHSQPMEHGVCLA